MAERLVISDQALLQELRKWIKGELEGIPGEKGHVGLYRMVARGVPNSWDNYQRMVGQVQALEAVLGQMQDLARQLGNVEEQVFFHPGMH